MDEAFGTTMSKATDPVMKMKLYLARDQRITLEAPTNLPANQDRASQKTGCVTLDLTNGGSSGSCQQQEYRTLLQTRMTRTGKETLRVSATVSRNEVRNPLLGMWTHNTSQMEVAVEGFFLRQLGNLLGENKRGKEFQIKIKLDNICFATPGGSDEGQYYVLSGKLNFSTDKCWGLKTDYITVRNGSETATGPTTTPNTWSIYDYDRWTARDIDIFANVTIAVMLDGTGAVAALANNKATGKPSFNDRTLNDEVDAEATILARYGVKIKCCKNLLMVRSRVFKAMFESHMAEAATSAIEMSEMTEESVRAFLAYLQCSATSEAERDCEVSWMLFKAGHKYDIQKLQEDMKEIFLKKDRTWYTPVAALKLFTFARNLEGGEELKGKVMQILTNMKGLAQSSSYQKFFRDCPEAAMDLCQCALDLIRAGKK